MFSFHDLGNWHIGKVHDYRKNMANKQIADI